MAVVFLFLWLVKLVQGIKSPSALAHSSRLHHFPLLSPANTFTRSLMASEPVECQVLVLRVSIHCEGCKKKVKKVLQNINGVYRCDIDARSNKVAVTASTKLDPSILVAKLRKSGKQAEPWPQEQPPAESQSQEDPKNQNDEPSKPHEPAVSPGADSAEAAAAEPSSPQPPPEPKQSTAGETPKPAQESKEAANADASGNTGVATPAATGQQQHNGEKGKAKQQPELEKQPVDARVTVEYDRAVGSHANRMPPLQQPVHVMSYNVARPSASASYYAPAPAPAPAPMPGPSQGYIDEHYTPSYYTRSSPYEPYYYQPPQASPYRYQYQPASSEDYYYGAPPQRSAFSPPRDGYGDMFNDENANSCSVM